MKMNKKQQGQGMTEYIIIVALIAVSAIGVYSFFGKTIRNQVSAIASEVSGQDSAAKIQAAKKSADDAATNADKDYNLGNFDEGGNKAASGSSGGS
ncbi:hypothetical protein PARC_a1901 [Pseudoalteromonas arctica A 37-1-2]|uniref:Pilus assembly protein n=2 Tax=Pseudoalteromonas TaxID=53246 RepID=A0A290S2X3_9GAMM|nr:hypothetical protein PARC_a1901 [Pseudoalteromonas arctica A 37-1-2]